MTDTMTWDEHQEWERAWWGECLNTYGEETKQLTYAHRMGLVNEPEWETWPRYDMRGKSVIDVGGGPVSMLLKCVNVQRPTVVDPCEYPAWVQARYSLALIEYVQQPAETLALSLPRWDEAWLYNVLQHTMDPERIVANARRLARAVRLFEWIDLPPCPGHPQTLTAPELERWLGGQGRVEQMNENGCRGRAFYGVFPGT